MILELDDDFTDEIVRQSLVQTYVSLMNDIKHNKNAHEDDVEIWKKITPAIEVLGTWYFLDFKGDVENYKDRLKKVKKKK
jgi:hypothetical protein